MDAGFRTKQLGNTYSTAANLLEQIMTLAILTYGAYTVMNGTDFTIGMLVAFQMFAGRLSQPMLRLVGLWQQFQQANISVQRLGDVMNAPIEPYAVVPQRESVGAGALEVRGLAFRYGPQLPYLYRDLNLTVQPGQCIAVMGPSGCGKSTLAKLLQGFYQPDDGQILIDGRDIRHLSANELRRHFGIVPQETLLFSGTVLENLMMANPHASFEQVVQACKMAEIHDFIDRLPKGYQTELGERGIGLSGGQRQRVAIARALLKRPQILVFDEAVSSLDAGTAEQIARTVNALKGRVSILFITHQVPRTLKVDSIFELGRIGDEKRFGVIQGGPPPQGARE
jgi:subfamily B ATP-binding cassette protein HlyB/CyaB